MGRPRKQFKKKDKFDILSEEFKDAVAQSSIEEIRSRISKVALSDCELRCAQKDDQDLEEKKQVLKAAQEPYRENFKIYKTQIEFCRQALDDKGGLDTGN